MSSNDGKWIQRVKEKWIRGIGRGFRRRDSKKGFEGWELGLKNGLKRCEGVSKSERDVGSRDEK